MIRKYTSADRQACIEIFRRNCPDYFDAAELEGLENWLNGQDKEQAAYKNSAADFFYVLAHKDEVIACGGFYVVKDKPVVKMAWGMVDRIDHRKGYGSQLLQFRIDQIFHSFPNHSIELDTSQHTFRFFVKHGFVVTNISRNAYGPGLDRYDMEMVK